MKITYDKDLVRLLKIIISTEFGIAEDNINLVGHHTIKIEEGDGDTYGFDEVAVNEFIRGWINDDIT